MPELLEVELYRRSVDPLIGARLEEVLVPDKYWARHAPDLASATTGTRLVSTSRRGKVLLLETDGPTIALRFGMTGRLIVDGASAVDSLAYGAHGDDPAWVRLVLRLTNGALWVSDPRRLGSVELDPDLDGLGPDAWEIDAETLEARLAGRSIAVKAALLDQARVAGLGNMLADEVLLRAGIHPTRPARTLTAAEVGRLTAAIGTALPEMLEAGGSHRGLLAAELRKEDAPCPLDGAPLRRFVIAGRSAYACSVHQR